MTTRVALCFPGQGSQAEGMAEGLFDLPLATELLAEATAHGLDLKAALQSDEETLRATEVTQPALLFVEALLASQLPVGLEIVGVAGHSVGEYSAAIACGALSPRAAMALVVQRGRLMADMHLGTMAAFIGLDRDRADKLCSEASTSPGQIVVVANDNAPGQVVLSGNSEGIAAAAELARAEGVRKVIPLRVSGAFHSPLMAQASAAFADLLAVAPIAKPCVPLVANVDAQPVADAEGLRERLSQQLVSPVRWRESVLALQTLGAEVLIEVGPGSVLTGLARRILPQVTAMAVSNLKGVIELETQLGALAHG